MIPWIPWAVHEPEPVEIKKIKIRTWKGEFLLDQQYTYGIFSKKHGKLIGIIFLFTRQGDGILEIGYIVDQDEAGKGIATEASYAVTKLSFEHIGIGKAVIICNPKNIASSKIPEKLNYRFESIKKEAQMDKEEANMENATWSLLIEEFAQNPRYEPVVFQLAEGW